MKYKDIKNSLWQFRNITPLEDFSKKSRLLVLSQSPENKINAKDSIAEVMTLNKLNFFVISPVRIASLLVVSTGIFVGVYYSIIQISPFILPGLNSDKIIAEADMINRKIDIEISQINHFKDVSAESNVVLNSVQINSFNHLNKLTIEGEEEILNDSTNTNKTLDDEINSILKDMSK